MKERMTAIIKQHIEGAEVKFSDVLKPNGLVLHGVNIIESSNSIVPCIYYDPDKITEENVEKEVERILKIYEDNKNALGITVQEFNDIMTADYVLANVYPFVLGYDGNYDMISANELVYRPILDLAILYMVVLPNKTSSFKMSYPLLSRLNITPANLHECAFDNIKKDLCIENMDDVLKGMAKRDFNMPDVIADKMFPGNSPFTIYSVDSKYRGAAVMFIDGVFGDNKCYVIPSSIHEVIAVSADEIECDVSDIKEMVMQINNTEVSVEDRLSDHVYYYNGESLEIAL